MFDTRTILMLLLMSATAVFAADTDRPQKQRRLREQRASVAKTDRSAVEFARNHHPELAALLEQLQQSNPRAYRAAIRDLSKDRRRLERWRERAPQRYHIELQLWTMDSRIRLMAAQAARGDAEQIRPRLQELLQERQEFRLSRLRQERERIVRRLRRVENKIQELEANSSPEADVDALLSRVKSRMQTVRKNARAAESAGASEETNNPADSDPQSQTDSPQD